MSRILVGDLSAPYHYPLENDDIKKVKINIGFLSLLSCTTYPMKLSLLNLKPEEKERKLITFASKANLKTQKITTANRLGTYSDIKYGANE